jgi:CheY-like chemotaxis protein
MSPQAKRIVILMADDDADDRLLTQDALVECNSGSDLRVVENGEELLNYLHRRGPYADPVTSPRPGLILLDLNMPKKDGRDALQEIKLHPELRKIPVVVLTTSKADTDISRIYELGANSFIAKPVSFDSLVSVMQLLTRYWFDTVELPAKNP